MDYLSLSISELHSLLVKGEISPLELTKLAIKKAKEDNNNAFEYICEEEAIKQASSLDESKKNYLLWGIPFVLKDNFSTKDIPTTASSDILKGYVPVFSSEVYLRLINQGAILIGKVALDELAMGGSGTNGHLGVTYNPWDKTHTRRIGGSSSGSAAACAAGIVPFAIGSDTGDSARKPASYAGLVGFKPTWGRISRYGLFPFACSLDHVGFFSRNVFDSALVLNALAGHDKKDMTSSSEPVSDYTQFDGKDVKGLKVAVIEEIYDSIKDQDVRKYFELTLKKLEEKGVIINRVHMDKNLCRAIHAAYIVLSNVEATSNIACYDGVKYGPRVNEDDYQKMVFETRTKYLSYLVKKRLIIGGYSLLKENKEEVFIKAQKCRHLVVNVINNILKDNDFIYLPSAPSIAPLIDNSGVDELSDEYLIADNFLSFANFGGQPSINIPIGMKDNMPVGGNITGRLFEEGKVLTLARAIEDITGLNNLLPNS